MRKHVCSCLTQVFFLNHISNLWLGGSRDAELPENRAESRVSAVPLMQTVHIPRDFALGWEKSRAAQELGACESFSDKPERL